MSKKVKRTLCYCLRLPNGEFKQVDRKFAHTLMQEAVVIRRGRAGPDGRCRIFALDIGGSLRLDYLTDAQIAANR